jgi:redox-sensitive bicupin YhaK (pirin superfamily)
MVRSLLSHDEIDLPDGSRHGGWSLRRSELRRTGFHGAEGLLVEGTRARQEGGHVITLRRANERHHVQRRKQECWMTFRAQDGADPLALGFGSLELLNEERLPPGAGASLPAHRHHDAEIVTYVREGALAFEDSMGRSGIIQTGEFQRMTAGRGIRHSEANASRANWAHSFQMWLQPSQAGLEPSHEQKRFSAAERRGGLCIVASPDGERGSLHIHQDARIYSSLLDPGQHVVHALSPGRVAWLHVVAGEVLLGDVILSAGDGAGITSDRAVSVTARAETEILLFDLDEHSPTRRRPSVDVGAE